MSAVHSAFTSLCAAYSLAPLPPSGGDRARGSTSKAVRGKGKLLHLCITFCPAVYSVCHRTTASIQANPFAAWLAQCMLKVWASKECPLHIAASKALQPSTSAKRHNVTAPQEYSRSSQTAGLKVYIPQQPRGCSSNCLSILQKVAALPESC